MAAVATDEVIGVAVDRAARVVGVSIKRLAAWEKNGLVVPRVHRQIHGRHLRVYGLDELVEACVIRELEGRGMTIRRIRKVVDVYRARYSDHPLRELRWATDGRRMYVAIDGTWTDGHRPGQGVIEEAIDLHLIRVEARRKAVARDENAVGHVEHRSVTMGSKAVFAGTRTPVTAVHSYLKRGYSDAAILEAFPHLSRADIDQARTTLAS